MSVRLRPAVRCTFDENEGVLRVVLKEAQERGDTPSDPRKEDVVVYALKVCDSTPRQAAADPTILRYREARRRRRISQTSPERLLNALPSPPPSTQARTTSEWPVRRRLNSDRDGTISRRSIMQYLT